MLFIISTMLISLLAALVSYYFYGSSLTVYMVIPFVLMLLAIAVVPLVNPKWWHKNFPMVAMLIAVPTAVAITTFNWHWIYETTLEYLSFIVLLGSLYIISGGILLKEKLRISSSVNTTLLVIGAIVANIIGTTGASMLLIRPLIRLNKERKNKVHLIVFFIFIVGNIAGSLTPLGDPPLFLGFLKGVPFFWTLRIFPAWLLTNGLLLLIFFITDTLLLRSEQLKEATRESSSIKVVGKRNVLLISGVIATMLIYSSLPAGMDVLVKDLIQIGLMSLMAYISTRITPKRYREENKFTWAPIKEVAILFAAIFVTMIPALKLLETRGAELGVHTASQFFWATGTLSSFLDNAPTYLSFMSLGKSITTNLTTNVLLSDGSYIAVPILMAISMGAVFMGAMTYIGNAPNFMIKSVSEDAGIKMPSFFGYMVWSVIILIPIFILNVLIFF